MLLKLDSGIAPGHDSPTGFPVRSHHLSGLMGGTAVKGELLHHNLHFNYTMNGGWLSIGTLFQHKMSLKGEFDSNTR
jgi:hypothetical protein